MVWGKAEHSAAVATDYMSKLRWLTDRRSHDTTGVQETGEHVAQLS